MIKGTKRKGERRKKKEKSGKRNNTKATIEEGKEEGNRKKTQLRNYNKHDLHINLVHER